MSPPESRARQARERWRRRRAGLTRLLIVLAAVGMAIIVGWRLVGGGEAPGAPERLPAASTALVPAAPAPGAVAALGERALGALGAPVRDAVAAPAGAGRALLAGGLTPADTSRADILALSPGGARALGRLPGALHDTAAVALGPAVYLFGGGDGAAQSDLIQGIDPATGRVSAAGRLPAPSSDQSAAAVDGTAVVVGGYTGSRWLDTVVAWRPGEAARVIGHLPVALRYAAVAAAGGRVVVAGGTTPDGAASDAVLGIDPRSGSVTRLGRLPAPTTHAAAAALGDTVYVIGGRGAATGSQTDRIVAVLPGSGGVAPAGRLASARSDLAAVALGDRILLAGGLGGGRTRDAISALTPSAAAPPAPVTNVYSADVAGRMSPATAGVPERIYVPNSESNTVDVINPRTHRVVRHFRVGGLPQHVVPSWDLRTLYVTNDSGNSLTPIDPRTGRPGRPIRVRDPYNMYFTPDGRFAIVVAEALSRLDFRDAQTMRLVHSLPVPCNGVDHMDFSADGGFLVASCEFSGQLVKVDVAAQRVVGVLTLPNGAMPQDVKLSPDGSLFYVADMMAGGVWEVDAQRFRPIGFLPTGAGAHGLYPSRDAGVMYVSNRSAGTVSVVSFATRRVVRTWRIPGGTPDMGGVSADGRVLWLSGRYTGQVYAIDTRSGRLLARIRVGRGPHGLCVWPQPGRYSLGHTGILR